MIVDSAPYPIRFLAILSLLWIAMLTPALAQTHPGQAELVREVAHDTGKSPAALNRLLDGATRQQSILDAISRPAEGKPWKDYRPIFVTDKRVNDGIAFYREHRTLLDSIGKKYGVAPRYIVAIVGVETSYGHNTGSYKVLDALVTLGLYYPPRAKFFREQLKELLEMPAEHLGGPIDTLTGSYAGAQGWGQFMPTSIRDYAVDEDHDGHIDLQNSMPDIFASVANYFARHGWVTGQPVAARAQPDASAQPITVKAAKPQWPIEQLEAQGYAPLQLLSPALMSSLQTLDGPNGPEFWFTFQNFYVITRYNRSPLYAMSVNQLADDIAAGADQADAAQ
ncbi:MAG: lytic murein transglycosylase B [Rhodanobacter sp.]